MLHIGIMAMCLASLSVDKGQEPPGFQEIIGVPLAHVQLTAFQAPAQCSLVYLLGAVAGPAETEVYPRKKKRQQYRH